MLSTWGGNGMDTISDEEYQKVGFDKCAEYCKEYCWYHGMGYCPRCALEITKYNLSVIEPIIEADKAESEDEDADIS